MIKIKTVKNFYEGASWILICQALLEGGGPQFIPPKSTPLHPTTVRLNLKLLCKCFKYLKKHIWRFYIMFYIMSWWKKYKKTWFKQNKYSPSPPYKQQDTLPHPGEHPAVTHIPNFHITSKIMSRRYLIEQAVSAKYQHVCYCLFLIIMFTHSVA